MRKNRRTTASLTLLLAVTAIAVLALLSSPPTAAKPPGGGGGGGIGRCECANLDAPVICDGGKIYSNPCVAQCFHATNCVPYGDGGGPALAGIRFCCTPQQSQACAAQGGTATCRSGVCQCLF